MKRKRDITPEAKLHRLIRALETNNIRSYAAAMELMLGGPMICNPARASQSGLLRAELLQFLRSAVRAADSGALSYSPIATSEHSLSFRTLTTDGRVAIAVDGHDARDLVILQLMVLLQIVGLKNVLRCPLPECGRIFVKRHKQEYCTPAHQGLHNKRKQRQNRREKNARKRLLAARKGV
jgi:hypothetical protein